MKKEVLELRKQFKPEDCSITRICGCYVDGEKKLNHRRKMPFVPSGRRNFQVSQYLLNRHSPEQSGKKSSEHGISTGTRTLRRNTGVSFAASRQ